ncbi:MAG: hypothetical protein COW63_02400 [Bacteroidetes bacterium CG18_big_fil_WC_8_21_14_2_50_41_14]|nr:MAG: hypothetical protein COW63_02400 [Bacteroidetes bacterium CG18_big_fil_WC_8_21_14_2_50_41_14]PJB55066.1 MAG: hypothetical protein CO098_18345 [Bacteroidetes bacterium CG_4_9_14_3_um_filter_41_19]
MKKLVLFMFSSFVSLCVLGQWTPIPIGTASSEAVAMASFADTVMVGFAGDGIFRTRDLGNSWEDISGDLANKNINRILPGPWPTLFVSTDNGPYFTMDQVSYINTTSTGLTNTDISLYSIGGELDISHFIVGTKGGGFFTGPELDGPWSAASDGLSGGALFINDMGGYHDGDTSTYILATDGGVYYSNDNFTSWFSRNNGLVGDQLIVTGAILLNTFSFITTEGGAFYSLDYGQNWMGVIENEKFNLIQMQVSQSGAFSIFILGETSYVSNDMLNWIPISTPGEVISAALTSSDLFIATEATKADFNSTSGLYRQPVSWILTALPENEAETNVSLKQNYPNPFSNLTTVTYSLSEEQLVDIRVLDLLGREVKMLVNSVQEEGNHEVILDASDMLSGVYMVVLRSEESTATIKIMKE